MILRRFMKHVSDQNWFAVGLDVLVVITGIFLGMQVQEIYKERGERETEDAYLVRLHAEVIQNLGFNKDNFSELLLLENFQQNEAYLGEILDAFVNQDDVGGLTARHCHAIQVSAIYNDQQTYLPTLSELLASGQLSIIQSEQVKTALSEYTMAYSALKNQVSQFQVARVALFEKYPDFAIFDRTMRGVAKVEDIEHRCDFGAMKANLHFNNDLTVATSKRYYFNLVLASQQQSLLKLHKVLDETLALSHEKASQ